MNDYVNEKKKNLLRTIFSQVTKQNFLTYAKDG